MKAFLLHRDRDFDLKRGAPPNEDDLMRDLELDTLLRAMAVKDELVLNVTKAALMAATSNDVATIEYRQAVLRDCLSNPEIVGQLYALTEEAFQHIKKIWTRFREYPSSSLEDSIERMRIFTNVLKKIRNLADRHSADFRSDGFTNLFTMLAHELDDEYFALIDMQLNRLNFKSGVLVSAGIRERPEGRELHPAPAPQGRRKLAHTGVQSRSQVGRRPRRLSASSSRRVHTHSRSPR